MKKYLALLTFLFFFYTYSQNNSQSNGTIKQEITSSWSKVNEKDEYHDFIVIPKNVNSGYVKVFLTQNNKDLKPGMVISRDLTKGGAIISGSSAQTNNKFNRTAYFSVHPGMTYSVRVYPFFNAKTKDYPVSYTLAWEFTEKPDVYEPNNTREQAKQINLNEQIEAFAIAGHIKQYYVGSSDDNTYDWYKVVLDTTKRLSVKLLDKPSDLDLNLRLFTKSGRQIGAEISNNNPNSKEITTRGQLTAGTYYLEVHPRMKGPRKSENDTKPIPDHFNKPYKFIVFDPNETNAVARSSGEPVNQNESNVSNQTGFTLDDLQGIWVRKLSNGASGDGLEVDVVDNKGIVTKQANSGFGTGRIKWSDINKTGEHTFGYKDLGSDYKYYPSSMKLISKNELELQTDLNGSIIKQRYERKEPVNINASLEDLQGIWVRKASNLPNFNGLEVEVNNNKGTLVKKANSIFNNGDIKWSEIKKSGVNTFDYKELGTDNKYYSASIKLVSKNVLEVQILSRASGNKQTWERAGSNQISIQTGENEAPIAVSEQNLPCHINKATRLVKTDREVDYYVDCVIDVTAPLTIEPGVVIEFGQNTGLGIYDTGSLKMIGTDSHKITFRGKQKREGYWRGIHSQSATEIEYAEIRHAGSSYVYCCNKVAAIFAKKGSLSVKNTKFGSNVGCEIFIDDEVEQFNNLENDIPTNGICYDEPEPIARVIDTATVLMNTPKKIDYYVPKNQITEVYDQLTIEPGVVIEFYEESGLKILEGLDGLGKLIANGKKNELILFRGNKWKGILTSSSTLLKHVMIEFGGFSSFNGGQKATLFAESGDLSLQDCSFIGQTECAVFVDFGVNFSSERTLYLYGAIEEACINDQILPGQIDTPTILKKTTRSVDYVVPLNQVVDVTAPLTIEPGVVIEFEENSGLGVYDAGTLTALGTDADRIIFKGKENRPGYWRGIHLETAGNRLEHIDINSAGSNYVYCCNTKAAILVKKGDLTIANSYIHDNAACGIYIKPGVTLTESGNTFAGNADGHICSDP